MMTFALTHVAEPSRWTFY